MNARLTSARTLADIVPVAGAKLIEQRIPGNLLKHLDGQDRLARFTKAPIGSRLISAEARATEFWETVGYAVIWLCGLTGIFVCLR